MHTNNFTTVDSQMKDNSLIKETKKKKKSSDKKNKTPV